MTLLGPDLSTRTEMLRRRLLVLEQLFVLAAADPDGHPFSGVETSAVCYGLVEALREIRGELERLGQQVLIPAGDRSTLAGSGAGRLAHRRPPTHQARHIRPSSDRK